MVATWSMLTPSLIMATTRSGTRFRNLTPWPPSLRGKGGNCFATPPPLPGGTVDFRRGYGSLPLKKGGQEGFDPASVGQIPLCPPFSKGEPDAGSTTLHLSTLPRAGEGGRNFAISHPWEREPGADGLSIRVGVNTGEVVVSA